MQRISHAKPMSVNTQTPNIEKKSFFITSGISCGFDVIISLNLILPLSYEC